MPGDSADFGQLQHFALPGARVGAAQDGRGGAGENSDHSTVMITAGAGFWRALPALGQLKTPATIPYGDWPSKEFRHR